MRVDELWLLMVVGRVAGFLFTAILLLTGVFFLGNVQEFTNPTQILVLKMIDTSSEVFLLAAAIYIILIIVEAIRLKRFFYGRLLLALSGSLVVSIMFVFSNFLNTWL